LVPVEHTQFLQVLVLLVLLQVSVHYLLVVVEEEQHQQIGLTMILELVVHLEHHNLILVDLLQGGQVVVAVALVELEVPHQELVVLVVLVFNFLHHLEIQYHNLAQLEVV
jgi:hypothetical protein